MDENLAIHGGKPVRDYRLEPNYPGVSVYGEEEKKAVMEVLEKRSPFRYYGPQLLGKVKEFEKTFSNKYSNRYNRYSV